MQVFTFTCWYASHEQLQMANVAIESEYRLSVRDVSCGEQQWSISGPFKSKSHESRTVENKRFSA